MLGSDPAPSSAGASPDAFATALDELKRDGCLLLVVGPVGDDAKYAACRRFLGDALTEDRRRLFVSTDTDISTHEGIQATCGHGAPADTEVITYQTTARSAVAPSPAPDVLTHSRVRGDPDTLRSEVAAAIDRLDERADGLAPAELRVCVDDVDALLAHADDVETLDFVSDLRDAVLAANGMCHAHISREVPATPLDALVDLFDVVVEVESGDCYRQRWHIEDAGISTDWLEL